MCVYVYQCVSHVGEVTNGCTHVCMCVCVCAVWIDVCKIANSWFINRALSHYVVL